MRMRGGCQRNKNASNCCQDISVSNPNGCLAARMGERIEMNVGTSPSITDCPPSAGLSACVYLQVFLASRLLSPARVYHPGRASQWHLIRPTRRMLPTNSWMLSDSPPPPHPDPFVNSARDPARHVTAAGHGVRAQRSARPPSEPVVFTSECLEQTSAHKTSPRIGPRTGSAEREPPASFGFLCVWSFFFAFFPRFCRVCFSASPLRAGTDEAVTLSCWPGDVSPRLRLTVRTCAFLLQQHQQSLNSPDL